MGSPAPAPTLGVPPENLLGPLNEIERRNAPERLWVSGDVSLLRVGCRASIVGSREASQAGLDRARRLAAALTERAIIVVSGLAAGIDTVAHRTAMERGGRTIAVLGTPLDQSSPVANRQLHAEIARAHLAVTQFGPGSQVHPSNSPRRSRTMALVSHATFIMDAGAKSGTEHQGWEAIRLGRPLFISNALVASTSRGAWIDKLLDYGAEPLTDRNVEQVLDTLQELGSGSGLAL
jgi:DNA processing protein